MSSSRSTHHSRSSSVPGRHFVFVVTNHPDFRRISPRNRHTPFIQTTLSSHCTLGNDREEILRDLLRVELREAVRHYLLRTRDLSSIEYVFFMSDVRSEE